MKKKIIYIDESGQEGSRLSNFTQNYYILAALEDEGVSDIELIDKELMKFDKYKFKQSELHSNRLNKKPNDLRYMVDILNVVVKNGYKPYLTVVQKECMAALTLANLLLDKDFNVNITEECDNNKKKIADKYEIADIDLYKELLNLSKESLNNFYLNFLKCNKIEEFQKILKDILMLKNEIKDIPEEIKLIFDGFSIGGNNKLSEFFEVKFGGNNSKFKRQNSINYFTFGTMLSLISQNNLNKFDVIHDKTDYSNIYLDNLEYFKELTKLDKLLFEDSKNKLQLQFVDLLAGITFYMFNNYEKFSNESVNLKENEDFIAYKKIKEFILSNTKLLINIHIICDNVLGENLMNLYKEKV